MTRTAAEAVWEYVAQTGNSWPKLGMVRIYQSMPIVRDIYLCVFCADNTHIASCQPSGFLTNPSL